MPELAAGLADVLVRDPHPLEAGGLGDQRLDAVPVLAARRSPARAALRRVSSTRPASSSRSASRSRDTEQARAAGRAHLPVEPAAGIGGREQRRELALELRDLVAQRSPGSRLVDVGAKASDGGTAREAARPSVEKAVLDRVALQKPLACEALHRRLQDARILPAAVDRPAVPVAPRGRSTQFQIASSTLIVGHALDLDRADGDTLRVSPLTSHSSARLAEYQPERRADRPRARACPRAARARALARRGARRARRAAARAGRSMRSASSARIATPVSTVPIVSASSTSPWLLKPPARRRSSTAASIGVRNSSGSSPIWRKKTRYADAIGSRRRLSARWPWKRSEM